MNKFIQHIPDFYSGYEKERFEFSTLEELLNHPIVKRWRMDPFNENQEAEEGYFHQYSISNNKLMAEFKNGTEWWVIGYILKPEKLHLPKWVPNWSEK